MEIDLIFKIAAVGIIVSILNQVLVRSGREEQATMTTLAGLVVGAILCLMTRKQSGEFGVMASLGAGVLVITLGLLLVLGLE